MRILLGGNKKFYFSLLLIISLALGLVAGIFFCFFYSDAKENRLLPVYQVETSEAKVALTFDVAWEDSDLEEILDLLEKYGAKATFFVTGDWLDRCPAGAQLIVNSGNGLQNHSNTHPHIQKLSTEDLLQDTVKCAEKIQAFTGKQPVYYRGPYGEYNNTVIQALSDYQVIQWNIDSKDWKLDATVESITQNVLPKMTNGSILLFHVDSKAKQTVPALQKILPEITKQYQCVLLEDLVLTDHYRIDHTGKQIATT